MNIVDALRGTALEIQEHGHAKGALVGKDGGMCILGAICHTVTGDALEYIGGHYSNDDNRRVISNVLDALAKHLEFGGVSELVIWNNRQKTTQEEVVGALIACAEIETLRTSAVVETRVPSLV